MCSVILTDHLYTDMMNTGYLFYDFWRKIYLKNVETSDSLKDNLYRH